MVGAGRGDRVSSSLDHVFLSQNQDRDILRAQVLKIERSDIVRHTLMPNRLSRCHTSLMVSFVVVGI